MHKPKGSLRALLKLVDSRSDVVDGMTSQAAASQIVVSTQYKNQHMHEAYQPQYVQAHHQEGEAQGEAHEGQAGP